MNSAFPVAEMTLRDIVPDLMHLLEESAADVDGITIGGVETHPAADPAVTPPGHGSLLVTFTDPSGRRRVAELEIRASWREDDCWHQRVYIGALGEECADCGMVTTPTSPTVHCPECHAPVTDPVTLFGVHTSSCPVVMCQCEHADHERGATGHRYLGVRAGSRRAQHVGLICDECADGHLAGYLVSAIGRLSPEGTAMMWEPAADESQQS